MSNPNFSEILKNFNQNQIREINAFLNSAKGTKLKNSLSDADKARLLQQFSKLDPAAVKKAVNGLSTEDLMKIIKKL